MSQSFVSFKLGLRREKNILEEIIVNTAEIVNGLTALINSFRKESKASR